MKIFEIGKIESEYLNMVGGKARGLDALVKFGFNVPKAFVITNAKENVADFEQEIYSAFSSLNCDTVSVRSSACLEDGKEYSSAGQYETFLFVKKDGLIDSIKKCIRSLTSARAESYNKTFANGKDNKMNVVIQRMIDPITAGVTFTQSPLDPAFVMIEAVKGVGESLVSGTAESEQYLIPRKGFSPTEGNTFLTDKQAERIYLEGLKIKETLGFESDLEWAINNDGELFWLQARPITNLSADPAEFDSKNPLDNHLLTTRNIGEMLPGTVTPLSISTSVLAIDYGIRNMFKEVGVAKKISDLPEYIYALSVNNHLFIDMTALHAMSKKVVMSSPQAMNLSIMGEYLKEFPTPEGKNAFIFTKLFNGIKLAKYLFSSKKAKKNAVRINNEISFIESIDCKEIYQDITNNLHYMNEILCHHYVCSSFSGSMNSALTISLSKKFKDKTEFQAFVSKILQNIDGIESADILRQLKVISKKLLSIDGSVKNMDENSLLSLLKDPANPELNALYSAFLNRHGHRCIKEAELRSKSWQTDQIALMKYLKTVISSIDLNAEEESGRQFNIKEVVKSVKGSKLGLKFIIKNARQAVKDREFSKSNIIKLINAFKTRYSLLAELLLDKGIIPDVDLIYFFTHEEIGDLVDGKTNLIPKAKARRELFYKQEELAFDDVYIGKPEPKEDEIVCGQTNIKGIPVCKGKVYGRARIVKSFEDAQKLEKGEIMVASFTDIGWSPYYSLVSGLITEIGSALSHGAVVAREYKLPTVVNAKNATRIIKDGDYLYMDGSSGVVSIVSEKLFNNKMSA